MYSDIREADSVESVRISRLIVSSQSECKGIRYREIPYVSYNKINNTVGLGVILESDELLNPSSSD
jgi:hypothetical protein